MGSRRKAHILPMLLVQSAAVIIIALASFAFMTWLVTDIFGVRNIYEAAGYEALGSLVIFIIVMVPLNTVIYRKISRKLSTLSDSIRKVAEGDYSVRIAYSPRDSMAPIYEDFNKMCAELGSVQMLRNDFINSYSHEFRTPIASINGFASLLLEKDLPEDERKEYLRIITDESKRLSELASSTILLSRLSAQQIITDAEDYDLAEQVRQCSIILSGSWIEKRIEFSGSFSPCPIHASRELLQHVWINILDNAIRYTADGGEISVSVENADGKAQAMVSDTGSGMDAETLQHLFDPYYRGDHSHSSSGLGLGLAIAKRVIDLSGGTIEAASEKGTGTVFTIRIPSGVNHR